MAIRFAERYSYSYLNCRSRIGGESGAVAGDRRQPFRFDDDLMANPAKSPASRGLSP